MRCPKLHTWLLLVLGLVSGSCEAPPLEPFGCDERNGIVPICGMRNPEDFALAPGGEFLLVSEYEDPLAGGAGRLSSLHLESLEVKQLYPAEEADGLSEWGDPDCRDEPKDRISPHGIDLVRRDDGRLELLVVNHGGRESVELFEVVVDDAGVALRWKGCVAAPSTSSLNDVVALPDGGFLVTHMGENATTFRGKIASLRAMLFGAETGHVLEWRPSKGLSVVLGTQAVFPNGIELSPDGEFIFLNEFFGNRVSKIRRATGERMGSVDVPHPDNSSWNQHGELLVASQPMSAMEILACTKATPQAPCRSRSSVIAVDPDSLRAREIFAHEGSPIGPVTMALQHGEYLYLGTFAADRIGRTRLAE